MTPARLCLLLALLPAPAWCAEWVRATVRDGHQHFYDASKLFVSGDEITYWRRVLFRTPQPLKNGRAKSAMYRERIHCKEHTHRTLGYLFYAADGAVLENVRSVEAETEPVIPETVGDQFEKLMCKVVAERHNDNQAEKQEDALSAEVLRLEVERLETRMRELNAQIERRERELAGAPQAIPEATPSVTPAPAADGAAATKPPAQ